MSYGSITGTKELAWRCALLSVSDLDNRWAVANNRQTESDVVGHWS